MIDTGEDDSEGLLEERTENCVSQKFETENQMKKILKGSGLTLVQLYHQVMQFPFSIFEYLKIRFDESNIISLS